MTAPTVDPVSRARLTFPLPCLVHHVKPSISVFKGNRSADPEYITDGALLLRTDAIRTPGRVKRLTGKESIYNQATTEQLKRVVLDATRPQLAPLDFLGIDPFTADLDQPKKYQRGPTAVFTNNGATEIHYSARYLSLLLDYLGPETVQLWAPVEYPQSVPAVFTPIIDQQSSTHCTSIANFTPSALLMPLAPKTS